MRRALASLGVAVRVLRRVKPSQIAGRLRLRWRQRLLAYRGFAGSVPRWRREVAENWQERLVRWQSGTGTYPRLEGPWLELPGMKFAANAAWLTTGPRRSGRHLRELPRIELFFHEFLREPAWSPELRSDFLHAFLKRHRGAAADTANEWQPYAAGSRCVNWLKVAANPAALTPAAARAAVEECLAVADYVEWMQERDIEANHWLKNLWTLAIVDNLIGADLGLAAHSTDNYLRELEAQLLPDGAHYELSPMYHAKVIADARSLWSALPDSHAGRQRLEKTLRLGAGWLESMRLAPQTWAGFNDSWEIPDLAKSLWPEAGWVPVGGTVHLRESGFIRGTSRDPGGWRWLLDVGGVGPGFNPGHCHSDLLSLILNLGDEPLLVDPGTLHYSPNDERAFLKSCHAHNGPCLAERDHTELVGSFRIGRAARCAGAEVAETDGRMSAFGRHRGYRDVEISRRVEAGAKELRIVDTWTPTGTRAGAPWSRMLWAVPIRQLRDVEVLGDQMGFRFPGDHPLRNMSIGIRVTGARGVRLCLAESFYSAEFGRTREAAETIVTATRLQSPASVETHVKIT